VRIAMIDQKGIPVSYGVVFTGAMVGEPLARVRKEYDWQNIVSRLEEVYRG
jgi:phosphate/sulfate permease